MSSRSLALLALVVAGESIFFLPFLLPRLFRPTLLEVFGLTNLELGLAFSAYGVVAAIAYFPGGPLADRFSPRKLLAAALVSTAVGGLLLQTFPSLDLLKGLYAYWGLTTIALFWAALIRATREWGGEASQGSAFGLLDGGRGLMAALMGSVMVAVFAFLLPDNVESASLQEREKAFRQIIVITTTVVFGASVLVLLALPTRSSTTRLVRAGLQVREVGRVLKMPTVWTQAVIILCAYVGFKATDDFSLYAREVLGMNEVDAAKSGAVSLWMRPLAAIGAGYLADRVGVSFMTIVSFVLLILGSVVLASGILAVGMLWPFLLTIVCASLGIFALRGLYYAVMKEGGVPLAYTGTAVGFVSVIGYTPDIFMGPLMGILLDQSPGELGHQRFFLLVAGFAVVGLFAGILFRHLARTVSAANP